jgi:cytochrome c553
VKHLFTIALFLSTACGMASTEQSGSGSAAANEEGGSDAKAKRKKGTDTNDRKKGGTDAQDGDAEDGDGSASQDDASDLDSGGAGDGDGAGLDGPGGAGNELTGKSYFEDTIFPLFTAQCASCHADPRMNPPQRGPLTIFSYENMRAMLEGGTSASDNRLSRKVRNVEPHGGGNRCTAGPTSTPCKEIMEWWRLELGADSGFDGRVTSVSVTGDVFGYAVDTRNEALTVTVRLLVDGQLAIETPASVAGADGNYAGDHAFKVLLPATVRDGKEHTLQAFASDVPIGPELRFTAYAPKDAGRAYYTNSVAPALTGPCGGCHVIQYEVQWSAMLAPAPHKGGTATANTLIDYSVGLNGHPGGNLCGSKTGAPCNLLQSWWSMEFGP